MFLQSKSGQAQKKHFPIKMVILIVFAIKCFSGNPKAGLAKLKKSTTCNGSCIRAENLLYLLDKHLNDPKKLTNDKLLKLFQINREIIKPDIDKLF